MSGDLKVGEALLTYGKRITDVQTALQPALDALTRTDAMVNGDGVYEGRARAELSIFYGSYVTHVQKLMSFYLMGARYLGKVMEDLAFTDEELAQLIQWYVEQEGQ